MPKKEAVTDLWVYELLKEADICLDPQGSSIKEIDKALKTASKSGKGNPGFPEYCGIIGDFLLVIEDKADLTNHIYRNGKGLIDLSPKYTVAYAVNGAYHYGLHLAKHTNWRKIFAIGISGDKKRHRITPLFINERGDKLELPDVETFMNFSPKNIDTYYLQEVLKEKPNTEKRTEEILGFAKQLHEDMRTYGSISDQDKPLVVSGILLALSEIKKGTFSIESLTGDTINTDGDKIYAAIQSKLTRADVAPIDKRDKVLNQFLVIKNGTKINEIDPTLNKTPLRYYTEFLYEYIFSDIEYAKSPEDYIGLFYGEFMSYSGGDGQSLGIVLTPKHITTLFCELLDVKPTDRVFDPCCGTGGFLIAAMHYMLSQTNNKSDWKRIKKEQLYGFELQDRMFSIAVTNMLLREDGQSNIQARNFLKENASELQLKGFKVGMMNPPYSQGTTNDPSQYEINFTEHLLDSMVDGGRVAVIVPQSSFTGKTREEQQIKNSILTHHTLEGVITLNKNTFYRVGTNPCIAIFTAGTPHDPSHICQFINFEDDGYAISKHIGLIETPSARDKRQYLLDVWRGAEAPSKFCVRTSIEAEDEWLHAFYYFNDEIPSDIVFERTIADYLSFEFNMLTHGRGYLFEDNCNENLRQRNRASLSGHEWKEFNFTDVFTDIQRGKRLKKADHINGNIPYVSSTAQNNGIDGFIGNAAGVRIFEDCIALANSGSVGTATYHSYKFVASDHVTKLKRLGLDKYAYLFMIPIINRLTEKYSFNREINDERIKREKMMLPITPKGEVDYTFMSNFMRNIEQNIIKRTLAYFNTCE